MDKFIKLTKVFCVAALILLALDLIMIFVLTPQDASQGIVQKIFYVHVPSAFSMYTGFILGFIFSVLYLWKRNDNYDLVAYSAIEVGFVFASCVLVSGPLWAKGAWGKFWDFDPRLTSTLALWFIFFSYVLLRRYFWASPKAKVFSAIIAILGFIDVPIIHYSVKIWRGVHPSVLAQRADKSLPPSMLKAFGFSVFTFLVVFMFLFSLKLRKESNLRKKEVKA